MFNAFDFACKPARLFPGKKVKFSLGSEPQLLRLATAAALPTAGHKNSPVGPVARAAAATPTAAVNSPNAERYAQRLAFVSVPATAARRRAVPTTIVAHVAGHWLRIDDAHSGNPPKYPSRSRRTASDLRHQEWAVRDLNP